MKAWLSKMDIIIDTVKTIGVIDAISILLALFIILMLIFIALVRRFTRKK